MDTLQDDISDVRDALRLLRIEWRTDKLLTRLHALAERSLFATRQMFGAWSVADTPNQLPKATFELWLEHLLETVVEIQLFPDPLPSSANTWEALAALWDEYRSHLRKFHMTGIRAISEGDPWSVRAAVRAAWNIELAAIGAVAEIGPVAGDSAHRTALRVSSEAWTEFQQYTNQASDNPGNRPRLWDAFAARWSSKSAQDQCEAVRARLAGEFGRMRAMLRGESPSPSATAAAAAQASIGNVIVHNQIVLPQSPETGAAGQYERAEAPARQSQTPKADAPPATKRDRHAKWLAEAMLLVRDHPDWSDREIAKRVGRHASTLARSKEYQAAAAMARGDKSGHGMGFITIDPDTGMRDVEAIADGDVSDERESDD